MAEVTVTTTVTITYAGGGSYSITEEKQTFTGDNPRFLGEHVGVAVYDVADQFRPAVEHRFGAKPA